MRTFLCVVCLFTASIALAADIAEQTEAMKATAPARDEASSSSPIIAPFPLALPGQIMCSPSIADVDGDGKPEILVTCRKRSPEQTLVHPEPNWAPQVFAIKLDGSLAPGWPVALGDAVITPKPAGVWNSSPSVIHREGHDDIAVISPFTGGGLRVIAGDGTMHEYSKLKGASVPLADVNKDGKLDILLGGVAMNVDGEPIAEWENRKLSGWAPCIGDADVDGELDIYQLIPLYAGIKTAQVRGFDHLGNPRPNFPVQLGCTAQCLPVMGDVVGDNKMEIIAIADGHVFAWTCDGQPMEGCTTVGEFNAVFKENVGASPFVSPTLADLDGDGKAEIIIVDERTPAIRAWHGDGKGVLNDDGKIEILPAPCRGVSVVDLGGDGVMDFFAGSCWVQVPPADREKPSIRKVISEDPDTDYNQPTVADLDGDGKAEVIFGTKDGRLFVYKTEMELKPEWTQWPTANGNFQHTGAWTPPK